MSRNLTLKRQRRPTLLESYLTIEFDLTTRQLTVVMSGVYDEKKTSRVLDMILTKGKAALFITAARLRSFNASDLRDRYSTRAYHPQPSLCEIDESTTP